MSQVADSQFASAPTGCTFVLREPIAKVTARRCRECGNDIFAHHRSGVDNTVLSTVLNVVADSEPTLIEPGILVGGFKAALAAAKTSATTVVLNCAGRQLHQFLPGTKGPFERLRAQNRVHDLEWIDSDSFEIPVPDISDAIGWVSAQLAAGNSVVINCAQGRSRSGAMAAAFLMHRHGIDSAAALRQVQQRRPFCQPNPGFIRQLAAMQQTILALPV